MVVVEVSHSMANSRTNAFALWSSSRSALVGLVRRLQTAVRQVSVRGWKGHVVLPGALRDIALYTMLRLLFWFLAFPF